MTFFCNFVSIIMNKSIIILLALSGASVPVLAQSEIDTASIQLRDVEIVGVKRMAVNPLEPVTTFDRTEIEQLDISAIKNIGTITPNFYMPDYGSRMTSSIYVRGIGARIDQPVVGLNIDNVPYLNKDNYDFEMFDIERVEVIRGAVGVLNGRNAMGGQINVHTLSPWKESGLRAMLEYGKANSLRVGAGYYGRLSPKLASSITGQYNHTDGFYRNRYDNSHVGAENAGGARWKLSWHPESRWSLLNVLAVNAGRQTGYPYSSIKTGNIDFNDPSFYRRLNVTEGLTATYTGNRMIATSVTSLQYSDDNMTLDQDFLPIDYFTLTQKRREWTWTQDLFAKGVRGKYNWLLGVFGFYKGGTLKAPVTFKDSGIANLIESNIGSVLPPGMELKFDERSLLLDSNFDTRNGGFAIYHQSAYTLGKFTFQLGLRWDIERIALDYASDADASVTMYRLIPTGATIPLATRPLAVHDKGTLEQTYNEILPQFGVGYASGNWQTSLRIAKGYKAGGYNTQMFSDILQQQLMESAGVETAYDIAGMLTYKPEKAWTYELSAEYTRPDRVFSAEAVLFLVRVRDQQLTVFPDGNTTGRAMTNAGRTRSLGAELSARWHPSARFGMDMTYGYTDARFMSYDNGKHNLHGYRLPYAPAHTMFVSADYTLPSFGDFTPVLNINTRGAGNIYWDDANSVSQKFYATLGASLTVCHRLGSLSLWGENLTDTHYNTFYFVSIGNAFVQRARPITFGATLRLNIE